jgi:rhamnogalacturonyl hydrolase YesR
MKYFILTPILVFTFCFSGLTLFAGEKYSKKSTLQIINLVNNYWQSEHPDAGNSFWDNAAYHTGNMEAYKITKNPEFLAYSEKWAEQNQWKGARGNETEKWKYRYGETNDHVLFGDWQICFQTYIDLYCLNPDSLKIARALQVINYQVKTPNNDYWWWVDGLYMVMPVMTKLYKITGESVYLDKLYEYYKYAEEIMLDPETGLFYRDTKYIYPAHKSLNGKKDFWSRGDGWLFAGLAKILQDLPENYEHRQVFVNQFKKMAETLKNCQQKGGYWTRSLLDPEHAPGYESSGTAFYTYGFLWGINNGLLKASKYKKTALAGWKYLSETALQTTGKIGYVQPIGEKAIPGQVVDANSTANFGVGAFLLASCEMWRYCKK